MRPQPARLASAIMCLCLLLAYAARPAAGTILYLDADPGPTGNTVNTNTNSTTDFWTSTDPNVGDNLWTNRTAATTAISAGDVLESFVPFPENSPPLTTTISGLNAGSAYRVYVVYGVNAAAAWNLDAGIAGNPLTNWNLSNGTVVVTDGLLQQRRGYLGNAFASGLGKIAVNVDDVFPGPGGDSRAWYDGVAYEEIPEPTPAALFTALGAGTLLARKRK